MSTEKHIFKWFGKRLVNVRILELFRDKSVPARHFSFSYYFGGAIFFLFILQVITGILLSLHYIPYESEAFKSMIDINTKVEFGWVIRSIHYWASHLMVLFLFLHIFTTFSGRSYMSPRELTWISGILLFGLTLMISFFGYLLPWDERSFFAAGTGIQIMKSIPFIGDMIVSFIQGSPEFTPRSLTRFYTFHSVLLPVIFFISLLFHLFQVHIHGISEPLRSRKPGVENEEKRVKFFPDFFKRVLIFWFILANFILILTILFPAELAEEANRFGPTPVDVRPEWYFLFLYKTLKIMPAGILSLNGEVLTILIISVLFLNITLIPFFDKKKVYRAGISFSRGIVYVFFLYILVMTIWGFFE